MAFAALQQLAGLICMPACAMTCPTVSLRPHALEHVVHRADRVGLDQALEPSRLVRIAKQRPPIILAKSAPR